MMPFRPFSFRQKFRKTKPAMFGSQSTIPRATITSASVEMVGEHGDGVIGAVQMSLTALFEGTSLAAKLPYISSIAGLLLHVLTMRKEVKQYKEECQILTRKLARVANIVVNVGELCKRHNLDEGDLPLGFRTILYSHLRELDGIEHVVAQCTKMKGVKELLLRNNLLTKIEQYDGELSNALQAFQAELSLDIRFALIAAAKKREVQGTPISKLDVVASPSGRIEKIPLGPLCLFCCVSHADIAPPRATLSEPNAPQIFSEIKSGSDVIRSQSRTHTTSRLIADSILYLGNPRHLWASLTKTEVLSRIIILFFFAKCCCAIGTDSTAVLQP
ncbi:hypothetical protein EDB87DRAFT_547945 [Lactarius vividus]|nr:hypothetical protein EDB87DRAFT_547945 [Lactarius vividus]